MIGHQFQAVMTNVTGPSDTLRRTARPREFFELPKPPIPHQAEDRVAGESADDGFRSVCANVPDRKRVGLQCGDRVTANMNFSPNVDTRRRLGTTQA